MGERRVVLQGYVQEEGFSSWQEARLFLVLFECEECREIDVDARTGCCYVEGE